MNKIADFIVKRKLLILIFGLLLLIPAFIGFVTTRINYDILVYLPNNIETIEGENVLTDDFKLGSYAFVMIDNKSNKEVLDIEDKIKDVKGVNEVVSAVDLIDSGVPDNFLPDEVRDKLYSDTGTLVMVTFNGTASSDETINAVKDLRKIAKADAISSMTAMVVDTMNVSDKEMIAYILIAVALCLVALTLATESYLIPVFLLFNIGIAVLYNFGSNIFLGEISYITKAIAAILQLGVTTDFSIFLYHKYEQEKKKSSTNNEAMKNAIVSTFKAVVGSSLTTFAGFLALCTMTLTLGTDIGIVMAKGVVFGLITVLTIFPALLLVFDKWIEKTTHRSYFPKFTIIKSFIVNKRKLILIIFALLLIPAIIGYKNYGVYYKLDESLPKDLPFNIANEKLKKEYNLVSPSMILVDKNLSQDKIKNLSKDLKKVEGIDLVIAPNEVLDSGIISVLPKELEKILNNDKYNLIVINSKYEIASSELNKEFDQINSIVKSYDKKAIVAGEGALMKDLVKIADHDFKAVSYTSILVILCIMFIVLSSLSLPFILILVIEFAIFLNMACAYFTGTTLPFIASIVVGTIQLGATIDYAILMSTRYLEERKKEKIPKKAMKNTLDGVTVSIITSALCFFCATIGVGVYTDIDIIGSICTLLARGSVISMLVVLFVLPSLLVTFDKLIMITTKTKKGGFGMKKINKALGLFLIIGLLVIPINAMAMTKKEYVFTNLDKTGKVEKNIVNNNLSFINKDNSTDETLLKRVLNISGDEKLVQNGNKIKFSYDKKDITYQGVTTKELPINVKIKYYLNNKEIDVDELVGKKGKVKIVLEFTNNMYNSDYDLHTPFVITSAMALKGKTNSNVEVTTGKVVNTGTRNIVVGISAPGLYEDLGLEQLKDLDTITINFDTNNFNKSDIYLIATPKLLDKVDLSKLNKLNNIEESMNTLQNGMNKLESGSISLSKGTKTFEKGTVQLNTGLSQVLKGSEKLKLGSKEVDDNLNRIITGLNENKSELDKKSNTLISKIKEINTLKENNNNAINSLTNANDTISQSVKSQTGLDVSNSNFISTITDLLNNGTINGEQYSALSMSKQQYEGNLNLISLFNANNYSIDLLEESLLGTSNEIGNSLDSLSSYLIKLEQEGTGAIAYGNDELHEGIYKLYNGSNKLKEGSKELNKGSDKLQQGISKINKEGISKLTNMTRLLERYKDKTDKLVKLSKDYKGYASVNSDEVTFIFKVNK